MLFKKQTIYNRPSIQLQECGLLHLGCVSNVNTHKILLKWWVLLNVSANWWDFFSRFLPHDQQTHNTSQSATGVPRYPALHCHWPLTSLRFQGSQLTGLAEIQRVGRTYVRIPKECAIRSYKIHLKQILSTCTWCFWWMYPCHTKSGWRWTREPAMYTSRTPHLPWYILAHYI